MKNQKTLIDSGSVLRGAYKRTSYWEKVIELSVVNGFVVIGGGEKDTTIRLTPKGQEHLDEGGFKNYYDSEPKMEPEKKFKEHLEGLTNLLTIFGILNAVIIFASQVKSPVDIKVLNLDVTGSMFISVSMYLLSILVLWEIITVTINEATRSFKFELLYFLLCTTTIGIGFLFISQYKALLYAAAVLVALFGLVWLIMKALLFLCSYMISRRNAIWFKGHASKVVSIMLFISIIIAGVVMKFVLRWILKTFL